MYFIACSPAVVLQDIAKEPTSPDYWKRQYYPDPVPTGFWEMRYDDPEYVPESERENQRDFVTKNCIREKHVKRQNWGVTYCLRAALPAPQSPETLCLLNRGNPDPREKPEYVYYPGHGSIEARCRLELWRALLAHAGVLGQKPPSPASRFAAVLAAFFARNPGLLRQIGQTIVRAYAACPVHHDGERLYHYDAHGKSCFSAEEAVRASKYLADMKLDERVRAHIQRTPFIIPQQTRSVSAYFCNETMYGTINLLKVRNCC